MEDSYTMTMAFTRREIRRQFLEMLDICFDAAHLALDTGDIKTARIMLVSTKQELIAAWNQQGKSING